MANSRQFREWFNDFYYIVSEHIYAAVLIFSIMLGLLFFGTWYGYRWYTARQSYKVYELLDQCMQEFNFAAQQNKSADWDEARKFCASGYKTYAGRAQAPYFLAFEAESLIQQGERAQAITVLDTMLEQLSQSSPIYYLYATKRALLLFDLDSSDSAIEQLTSLADNKNNIYRDYATYQLGYYYWVRNHIEKAREIWKRLLDQVPDELLSQNEKMVSPWALLAKSKLGNLASTVQVGAS